MALAPKDIRNIAIVGSSGTGKTSLLDSLAFQSKAVKRHGKVTEGTSISDFLQDEIDKKISISTAVVSFTYEGVKTNFLDTPGCQDFIGEAVSSLRAADIALIVVAADEGIQFSHRKYIKEANKDKLGKVFFINKLDKDGTSFETVFESIKSSIKTGAVPLEIPIGSGEGLKGMINLLNMKAFEFTGSEGDFKEVEVPADLKGKAEEFRLKMIEGIAEGDDALIEKYFDTGTLTEDEIHKGLVDGLVKGKVSAIACGSADKVIGMHSLLDVIHNYMPSPADREGLKALSGKSGSEVEIKADPAGPFAGLVFKSTTEAHVGELNFIRVFSGTLKTGLDVANTDKDHSERIGQMFVCLGKERKEVKELVSGDIAVLVKLKDTHVGDTLSDPKSAFRFEPLEFPKPVLHMALEVADKADEDKLGNAMSRILQQDPTLTMRVDSEIRQTIISGMGDQQIDMLKKQLASKFNVNIELVKPKIKYRETIKKTTKAQGRHKKQSGGRGQFGDCWVELVPLSLDEEEDFVFENKIFGGSIPSKYVPAVEKGVHDAMERGFLAGYRVIKIKAKVYDGSFHAVDSSDMAFQIAGSLAFKAAAEQASPILLEPVNKARIMVSDAYLGDVMGDLNGRRGKILGMDDEEGLKIVNAFVPDAELYKYSNDLRSMTQGTGTFEMEFDHYEEVPQEISQKIIGEYKKKREAEQAAK